MINKLNTVFVTTAKDNKDLRFIESECQAKALGIPIFNIHNFNIHNLNFQLFLDEYENVIMYNYPLIYFSGSVSNFERESLEIFRYCYENKKNLIIFNDPIYQTADRYKIGFKKLGWKDVDVKYCNILQTEFPVVNSRQFFEIKAINENPSMDFFYGCNNYKFRQKAFDKYIKDGGENFHIIGSCINLLPECSKVTRMTKRKIDYFKYVDLLNNSYATILILDDRWNNINAPLPSWRFIEAWTSGCICFICDEVNPSHSWMKNDDFFYVNSFEELQKKINMIKADSKLRFEKLNYQLKIMNEFDKQKYSKEYWSYIESICKNN